MHRAKLNFRTLSVPQKIARARDIIAALDGNSVFPHPTPPLTNATAIADAIESVLAEREAAVGRKRFIGPGKELPGSL